MRNTDRSVGTLVTAILAAGLLAGSMALPWFEYASSSGRKTAPGGYNDPQDTRVEKHSLTYAPFLQQGDAAPTHPEDAAALVQRIGWATVAGAGLAALVSLADIPGLPRILPRRAGLALLLGSLACTAAALWWAWYQLPATLDGYGVTQPFTAFLGPSGYVRTTMGWGWALAAGSVPLTLGALLFKFQAGVAELPKPKGSPGGEGTA